MVLVNRVAPSRSLHVLPPLLDGSEIRPGLPSVCRPGDTQLNSPYTLPRNHSVSLAFAVSNGPGILQRISGTGHPDCCGILRSGYYSCFGLASPAAVTAVERPGGRGLLTQPSRVSRNAA